MIPLDQSLYPVSVDDTWDVIDTSKIKQYLDCPRSFFYRYVLGWTSTAPNNHLIFGEGFHRAMAHLLLTDYSSKSIQRAFNEHFLPYYREHFPPTTDALFGAKTPDACLFALSTYCQHYHKDFDKFDVLHVEVAGVVPISIERMVHFRIDAICQDSVGIFALEHKTGSGISRYWNDQWDLDLQPATYTHALRCAYPDYKVRGCMMNGVHFKKLKAGPKIELSRLPIWKSNHLMGSWLFTVNSTLDRIEHDFKLLTSHSDSSDLLECFPMNPNNCTKYFGCPYKDFCGAWANPIQKADLLPMGMKVEFWDPRSAEHEGTYKLNIEEK